VSGNRECARSRPALVTASRVRATPSSVTSREGRACGFITLYILIRSMNQFRSGKIDSSRRARALRSPRLRTSLRSRNPVPRSTNLGATSTTTWAPGSAYHAATRVTIAEPTRRRLCSPQGPRPRPSSASEAILRAFRAPGRQPARAVHHAPPELASDHPLPLPRRTQCADTSEPREHRRQGQREGRSAPANGTHRAQRHSPQFLLLRVAGRAIQPASGSDRNDPTVARKPYTHVGTPSRAL